MKSRIISLVLLLLITLAFAASGSHADEGIINITVAPNTLNIQSQGTIVTVHTNIAYSAVDGSSVTLNGIEIEFYKADNQGNFVAKFEMSAVKDLVDDGALELGTIILTLEGMTTGGESFTGDDIITVMDNVPAGK